MKKYFFRYLIFWAPAVLVSVFYNNPSMPSQILQWLFAFFMIFGWSVNTGMFSYRFPRAALSTILLYMGINVLLIVSLYSTMYGSVVNLLLSRVGGLFSYQPLDILVRAILDFNIPHELYVLGLVVGTNFLGYVVGVITRHIRPNPYSPRMVR